MHRGTVTLNQNCEIVIEEGLESVLLKRRTHHWHPGPTDYKQDVQVERRL